MDIFEFAKNMNESAKQESHWIPNCTKECPIPWAVGGEYELMFKNGRNVIPSNLRAGDYCWMKGFGVGTITHWRLTDGWLPVLDGKCPKEIGSAKAGEWEIKFNTGGQDIIAIYSVKELADEQFWRECVVAVRLIKPEEKPVPQMLLREVQDQTNWNAVGRANAYLRFRSSLRGLSALAQIGKAAGPQFKPLGDDAINNIAAAALHEHDKIWPRKI